MGIDRLDPVATITVSSDNLGGLRTLADILKTGLRTAGKTVYARVDKHTKAIYVTGDDISEDEINKLLSNHTHFQYNIDYHGCKAEPGARTVTPSSQSANMDILKTRAKHYKDELGEMGKAKGALESRVSDLEKRLVESQQALQAKTKAYDDLQTRTEATSVRDLPSDIMKRENKLWENFVEYVNGVIRSGSEIYDIPIDQLERACLDYKPLEQKSEFQKVQPQFKDAKAAIEIANRNAFIRLDEGAKAIVEFVEKLQEQDRNLQDVRSGLRNFPYIQGREMTVMITGNEGDLQVTLPFKYKEHYPLIEKEFVVGVECYLRSLKKTSCEKQNANGLLRYKLLGIGKRQINRLPRDIAGILDAFTKLGGVRQIATLTTEKSR